MNKKIYCTLISSISILVFLVNTSSISATSIQYFPLGINTSWTFDSSDGSGTWTTRRYIGED